MRNEWAYFIGGSFDLTKKPKPAQSDDRYLRMAIASAPLPYWRDEDVLSQPVPILSQTYRLINKVPLENGDIAWIYVLMPERAAGADPT